MLRRVENGLIEHFLAGQKDLRPQNLFNETPIEIDPLNGLKIEKESFIQTIFPFEEFTILLDLQYNFDDNDFIMIYLTDGDRKSGVKIEAENRLDSPKRIKITRTASAFSVYQSNDTTWEFISTFNPPFEVKFLGFYSSVDFFITRFQIFKSPFIRFFIQHSNTRVFINDIEIDKNDYFFLYEFLLEQDFQDLSLKIVQNDILVVEQPIRARYGDVYYYTTQDLQIEGVDFEDFNYVDKSVFDIEIVNYTDKVFFNVDLYASFEPALVVYFIKDGMEEPSPSANFDRIEPGQRIPVKVIVRKVANVPWKRYNFNLFLE